MTELLGGDVSGPAFAALLVAALLAGWLDAVVGGGGLVQLPALLLAVPGASPVQALATNKVGSIFGTATSAITYYRRVKPDLRTALPLAVLALAGALGGAACASLLPEKVFGPLILVLLVAVGTYTVMRPSMGDVQALRWDGRRHYVAAGAVGAGIGFYDGIFGPGTGSFFVFALVGLLGYAFVEASAKAKIANFATNLGALLIFIPQGAPMWGLGLCMGAANILGGYVGARTAVAKGSRFVRVVFLLVVGALTLRLGYDVVSGL